MPLVLLIAADVGRSKRNLEVTFPDGAGVPEIEAQVIDAFAVMYPGEPFNLGKMQAFDEDGRRWIDVRTRSVLKDYMQIYAFNKGVQEVQEPIPPPIKVVQPGAAPGLAPAGPPAPAAPVNMVSDGFVFPTLSDDASHEEKVQCCFDEADANGNRVVEPEEFRRAFRVHSFDFSSATVTDLFAKADHDGDGVVTFPEFQRFAEMYPTLIDSLYFRIRDYWEDMRQQQAIQTADDRLRQQAEAARLAAAGHEEAVQATRRQEHRLEAAECAVKDAVKLESAAKAHLQDLQRELEALLRDRASKERELEVAQEEERQKVESHADLQRQADRIEQELAWLEAEFAKAEHKVRQAAGAVEEAKNEVDRANNGVADAEKDREDAERRKLDAEKVLDDARRATRDEEGRLADAEAELKMKADAQREVAMQCEDAAMAIDAEKQRRLEDEAELDRLRQKEQQALLAQMEAQRYIEEQKKMIAAIQDERQAAIDRRRQVEDQERPLLEQEVRLREQRESLEQNEMRLRREASAFHAVRGGRAR
eukprot:TRINITY_DN2338_c0_g1_i1.p1 TRINITY_DN2338_c0_g1~~TRINITY_DN2338_c0_g1_i1.p1  ORF type:complete len:535 (+),score=246.08 TRINITY_DN2338_c0_g1_i1:104-1708(+)